jgi:hypothetical protein
MLKIRVIGIVLTALFAFGRIFAQEVQFTGSAKAEVSPGETFSLNYSVNAQGVNFRGPAMPGFQVVSGPNLSTSSSIRSVNGRTTMSITNMYTYFLQAIREGTFEIAPASVTVDGKAYSSNTVTIRVTRNAGGTQNPVPGQGTNPQNQTGGQGSTVEVGANDVFLKAFVTNPDPYQGQGIVITYKIYTKVPISQIAISKVSSFQGFWSQNLMKENEKFNQYTQVINGEQYVVADIRKISLFPLKSGRLVIEPLELECVAQIKRQTKTRTGDPFFDDFFNDSFFSNSYASVEKTLKSNPLVINVKSLPVAGKPADFSGAVGTFAFQASVDKTKAVTNDAITLRCTVSGEGNIQLIDKLNVTFPPDFETYEPKVTSNISTTASVVSGSQTFEYLMIPRKPGKFLIKPIAFTYFDLRKGTYVTLSSPSFALDVARGTGDAASVSYSIPGKEDIKYIGSDIRHIKSPPFLFQKMGSFFFGTPLYFLFLVIPVLLFLGMVILWKRQETRKSDTQLMKNLKATKVARHRLKKAFGHMKEGRQEEFFVEISQALWGYLSDKFSIPLAGLSMESVSETLADKGISGEIRDQFIRTLQNTEYARFAPGEKTLMTEKIYQEGIDIISKIERELRG